jgi:hypothetical protein
MAATPTVGVIGLRALNRDLNRLVADRGPLNKAFQRAGRAAAEPVAAAARSAFPQVSGRLAGDVRVTSSRTGAAVRVGRAGVRYAGWVEFGGNRKAPHPSSRPFQPRGRYLFPAAIQLGPRSAELYAEALTKELADFDWSNVGTDGAAVRD